MWVQDRLDEGRQVAERSFNDGRKVAERSLGDGQRMADRTWRDGRRIAERAYDDGRQLAGRAYLDGRREAQHRFDAGRHLVAHRLNDGRKAVDHGRRALRDRFGERAPAVEASAVAGTVVWSALLLAAGAGVAYFFWNQYRRGRSDSQGRSLDEAGGEGPYIAKPEMVMAHNTAPSAQGANPRDPSDADLTEPAEDLLLHAPLDDALPEGRSLNAMKAATGTSGPKRAPSKPTGEAKALTAAATAAQASRPDSLESSLAVQGAAAASKRKSPNGATTPAAKPTRKGPTVM